MLEKICEILRSGGRFLITTHIDPDGDAIGSVHALYFSLRQMGKKPVVFLQDSVPYRYEFLPGPENIARTLPETPFDALLVLDCGNIFRVGKSAEKIKDLGPVVSIDHHLTSDSFGDINFLDASASSTGEILYRIIARLPVEITPEIALNLYTAILTDTGSFRYENTTPEALSICENLVISGVQPAYVAGKVYENHPIERFRLFGEVLSTLATYDGGRVITGYITGEMFRRTGTSREHADGFVEEIKQIRGAEIAIMIRELNRKKHKISMRSKGSADVAFICNKFGGGGHRNAAGCTIDGTRDEVTQKLKEALNIQ